MKNIWLRIRLFRALFKVVKNPYQTDEVFKVTNIISKTSDTRPILAKIYENESSKAIVMERYRPPECKMDQLLQMPVGSLGYAYARHLRDNGLDIHFYPSLPLTNDLNYIRLRLVESHDIHHVVLGFDTSIAGEAGLLAFYFAQTHIPVGALLPALACLHLVFYRRESLVDYFESVVRGWKLGKALQPVISIKWEERLQEPLAQLRVEMGLSA